MFKPLRETAQRSDFFEEFHVHFAKQKAQGSTHDVCYAEQHLNTPKGGLSSPNENRTNGWPEHKALFEGEAIFSKRIKAGHSLSASQGKELH